MQRGKGIIHQPTQIHHFWHDYVCIRESKIASYLKLKKDDRLLVSSAFWTRIRLERYLKVRPKSGLNPIHKARPDLQLCPTVLGNASVKKL